VSIDQLRPEVVRLAKRASIHAYNWMLRDEPDVDELREQLAEVVSVYTQSVGVLAADWYNNQGDGSSYFAFPVDEVPPERLDNLSAWIHAGPQRPESRIKTAAHTLAFDAARRTVFGNAQAEGVAVVRYEYGDSCEKCIARATTAPKASNSSSDDVAKDFHHSCEGMLVPVRSGLWQPPEYARAWRTRVKAARRAGNTDPDDIAKWLSAN